MISSKPWLTGIRPYDIRDKEKAVSTIVLYMLNRTNTMFKWKNLPDTIPGYILEQMLQANGHCIIADVDGKPYAFTGGYGGIQDMYYRGTRYEVANPFLNVSKSFEIGKDCVFCRNDHLILGLVPMISKYATLIAENETTLLSALVSSRALFMATGSTDKDVSAINEFLNILEKGKLSAVLENSFAGGIKAQPLQMSSNNQITNIIEAEQFLWAKMWNELGLDSNYNMKRESLTTSESDMNADALMPLVDDMDRCRYELCEEAQKVLGLSLDYEFDSSWHDNQVEIHENNAEEDSTEEEEEKEEGDKNGTE